MRSRMRKCKKMLAVLLTGAMLMQNGMVTSFAEEPAVETAAPAAETPKEEPAAPVVAAEPAPAPAVSEPEPAPAVNETPVVETPAQEVGVSPELTAPEENTQPEAPAQQETVEAQPATEGETSAETDKSTEAVTEKTSETQESETVAVTESESESETAKETEKEKPGPTKLTATCNGIQITVTAKQGVLKYGTKLNVKRVSSKPVEAAIEEALDDSATVEEVLAFDITLLEDGKEVQPDGRVNVTFDNIPFAAEAQEADKELIVAHVTDNMADATDMGASVHGDEAVISTTHFSVYAVALVANSDGSHKEITEKYQAKNNFYFTYIDPKTNEPVTVTSIAFDFHIFAVNADLGVDTHGNVAVVNAYAGRDVGTNADKSNEEDEVNYFQTNPTITNIRRGTTVLGNGVVVDLVDNDHRVQINNGQTQDHAVSQNVYQEGADSEHYIDIQQELDKLKGLSVALAGQDDTIKAKANVVTVIADNQGKVRGYNINLSNTDNEVNYWNVTAEELKDMDVNITGGKTLVVNINMNDATPTTLERLNSTIDGHTHSEENAKYDGNVIWNLYTVEPDGTINTYQNKIEALTRLTGSVTEQGNQIEFTVYRIDSKNNKTEVCKKTFYSSNDGKTYYDFAGLPNLNSGERYEISYWGKTSFEPDSSNIEDTLVYMNVGTKNSLLGTILAPAASINFGQLNGTMIAENIINIGGESHKMNFNGFNGVICIAKKVTGDVPSTATFTVEITSPDVVGFEKKTLTIGAGKTVTVGNLQPGTYIVKETEKGDAISTTVNGTPGDTIEVELQEEHQNKTVVFVNNFDEDEEDKGSLTITKAVTGDTAPASGTKFSVTVKNDAGKLVFDGSDSKTVEVGAGSSVTLNDLPTGSYTVEETDNKGAFATTVSVNGAKETSGTLTTVTVGKNQTVTVGFTNKYYNSTTASFGGKKTINDTTSAADAKKTVKDFPAFTFTVTAAEGTPMPSNASVQNDKKTGEYSFGNITYTAPGPYVYTITETGDMPTSVTKDLATYTVTVAVAPESEGSENLQATVTYKKGEASADSADFENTYAAKETKAYIEGLKTFDKGRTPQAEEFLFELAAVGSAPMPEGAINSKMNARNGADGAISFGPITYKTPGEYSYIMREIQENDKTVKYDESKYTVKVNVEDKNGELEATVSYPDQKDKVTFVNKVQKTVKISKKDAANNAELPGAKMTVVEQATGKLVDSWTSTTEAHEVSGIELEKVYVIRELVAPTGYDVVLDITFSYDVNGVLTASSEVIGDTVLVKDNATVKTDCAITVTKELMDEAGLELKAADDTFYVALFEDSARTKRVSDVKALHFVGESSTSVTFENLTSDKDYYVGETTESGELLTGKVSPTGNGVWAPEYGKSYKVTPTVKAPKGSYQFGNRFFELPDHYTYVASLSITKKTIRDGKKEELTDKTFYAAIFDENGTRVQDVTLEMNGESTVTKTFNFDLADKDEVKKFFVAETVSLGGEVVDNAKVTEYQVSYDKQNVEISYEHLDASVTITNDFETPETETEKKTEKESETESKKESAKTGDNTPIAGYVILFAMAAVVLLLAVKRRKRG